MKTIKRNGTQKRMFENIYDILANNSNFKEQATRELKKWTRGKAIEIDYSEGREATIKIGRDFTITLKGIIK